MSAPEPTRQGLTFSTEAIRWLVGFILFLLPIIVVVIAQMWLMSISASYYTGARDFFVGSLFILAACLLIYKGHTPFENWMANLGALAAVVAAVIPTGCDMCPTTLSTGIHLVAGATLFGSTVYFCLGPFSRAAGAKEWPEARRRVRLYRFCGYAIVACLVILGLSMFLLPEQLKKTLNPIYWGELVMCWLFSLAWLVASKWRWLPGLTDKKMDESLNLGEEFQLRVSPESN